jgi:ATP-binding cassette, subfamily A (ABC1), member 3
LITLGLLYPVASIVRYLVLEKELRQKELMKMMSVRESDIEWSWFVSFFVMHLVTTIGTTSVSALLYENSARSLLFFFWLFTFLAIIAFTFFLAALFSKATRATLVSLLVFFVGYFLTLVVSPVDGNIGTITLISLHPVAAFAFGLQEIGRLEDLGVGLAADTLRTTDSPSGYTFSTTLQNLLFDFIFWGLWTLYTNRIARSEFGRPLPWYFPCTLSYWCPGTMTSPTADENEELVYDEGVAVEPVSNTLKDQAAQGKSIEIRKLRKVFGEKIAVDGLSMSFYSGQITALLGHNGAGRFSMRELRTN